MLGEVSLRAHLRDRTIPSLLCLHSLEADAFHLLAFAHQLIANLVSNSSLRVQRIRPKTSLEKVAASSGAVYNGIIDEVRLN